MAIFKWDGILYELHFCAGFSRTSRLNAHINFRFTISHKAEKTTVLSPHTRRLFVPFVFPSFSIAFLPSHAIFKKETKLDELNCSSEHFKFNLKMPLIWKMMVIMVMMMMIYNFVLPVTLFHIGQTLVIPPLFPPTLQSS